MLVSHHISIIVFDLEIQLNHVLYEMLLETIFTML